MTRPKPSSSLSRKRSAAHYQTFPTQPPKTKGQPPSSDSSREDLYAYSSNGNNGASHRPSSSSSSNHQDGHHHKECSPLPVRQLCVLAFISLCEQTALNSIGPYLPQMASSFPFVHEGSVGLYVGSIASAFALAQFATNFFWGWLSDRIGRKPVVLAGTLMTAGMFVAFGFVRTFWQAVLVQVGIGLVNGNQGVISTCLGEITDRSNQSRAFIYLPVIYGLGGITGPVLGGLLVSKDAKYSPENPYPYMRPNMVAAALLVLDLLVAIFMLEESLEEAKNLPPLGERFKNLFSYAWQAMSRGGQEYTRVHKQREVLETDGAPGEDEDEDEGSDGDMPTLLPHHDPEFSTKDVMTKDTVLLLLTYLIFQFSNISYGALYPVFGQAHAPRGRGLSPQELGFSQAFAGAAVIVFQLGIFGRIREKIGNRVTYRSCIGGIALAYFLTPWVGYKHAGEGELAISHGVISFWIEMGLCLLIKSLAAVGCLTSFLLLLTNSAPSHTVLGTLNGLAQTLSAAGRAAGPFLAGGLFSLTTNIQPKGEAVSFSVFGAIAAIGCGLAFGIRGSGLEGDDDDDSSDEDSDSDDEEEAQHA